MRYRALTKTGDYSFGEPSTRDHPRCTGKADFLVNSPDCVAQAILTRLKLLQGEWFVDILAGTPYHTKILGERTQSSRDIAVRQRILQTQGVRAILSYSSHVDDRDFIVAANVDTIYGAIQIQQAL